MLPRQLRHSGLNGGVGISTEIVSDKKWIPHRTPFKAKLHKGAQDEPKSLGIHTKDPSKPNHSEANGTVRLHSKAVFLNF